MSLFYKSQLEFLLETGNLVFMGGSEQMGCSKLFTHRVREG